MAELLRKRVASATERGIEPSSAQAGPVVDELVAAYARHVGSSDDPDFRSWLLQLMDASGDRRYERYWHLLAVINEWPDVPSMTPAAEWFRSALRARCDV